jgi:lactate permease
MNSALRAWSPFILIFVLLLFTSKLFPFINGPLSSISSSINIYVGEGASPTGFTWINTPGVWIILSGIIGGLIQGASIGKILGVLVGTVKKNVKTIVTICSVLATAKIMVHSGMTTDVADVLVAVTGKFYPLFSPLVGVLGAFVTGSGTSTGVLFGPLQSASATQLGLSPEWLCAANSLGAGVGKMISPSNIALATASAGLAGRENEILSGVFKYCILYAVVGGIICFAFV